MATLTQVDFEYVVHLSVVRQGSTPLPTRWWTGPGTLRLDVGDGDGVQSWRGTRWNDQEMMDVGGLGTDVEGVAQRVTISIRESDATNTLIRALNERDLGPIGVKVYKIYRATGAETWTRLPDVVRGRTSRANFVDRTWRAEVENRNHDADRARVNVWSHTVQSAENPGDLFFEFTESLEQGNIEINWPR